MQALFLQKLFLIKIYQNHFMTMIYNAVNTQPNTVINVVTQYAFNMSNIDGLDRAI